MRSKRVVWLLNHRTLHDAEVPLLRSFGAEVFTPKIFGSGPDFRSCVPFWSDDETLTISPRDLSLLNGTDFYHGPWSREVSRVLNQEFDAVICSFYPELIASALRNYAGLILLRAFGREGRLRYSDLLGRDDLAQIGKSGGRVRFAAAYGEIIPNEGPILRSAAIHLPLALPPSVVVDPGRWSGDRDEILFVCPEIASSPYYGGIYREFKRWFGDLPHAITGQQTKRVEDPAVLGFVPEARHRELFRRSRVMFYHSREPRHLHYHPLEAVAAGLPLVYLRDGWLGSLGRDLPGACSSLRDARRLIARLLAGDRALAEELRAGQGRLIEPFALAPVAAAWKERFAPLLEGIR